MSTPWGEEPPPVIQTRFLYGKVAHLDDTTSTTQAASGQLWRIFNDDEEERLQRAWLGLTEQKRDDAVAYQMRRHPAGQTDPSATGNAAGSSSGKEGHRRDASTVEEDKIKEAQLLERTIANPDAAPDSLRHHVAVGQDHLLTVDLHRLELFPIFWPGSHVPVQNANWFVPNFGPDDRVQPVQAELALKLEAAYHKIGSWHSSYSEELAAAIGHGAEAEAKLRVELDDIALDVIFQGPESARIYNRGVVSRLSKSLLTTFFRGGTHSGGQLVLRGWQACEKFKQKTGSNSGSSTPAGRSGTPASSHTPRSSLDTKSTAGESSATAAVQGYGSSLYDMQSSIASGLSRYWYANQKEGSTEPGRQTPQTVAEQATSSSSQQQTVTEPPEAADATIQNLQQPAEEGAPQQRAEPKHPEELVLCIHGIGQKLADTYDRFSFVHAVNELRTHAARHSSDPAFSDVIKGKRLQFLPVRWRSQLQLHESKTHRSGEGDEDPFEDNEYSIRDVEPAGMSSLRAVVSDICLDVPHYMSHHRQNMVKVVVQEANRIYRLFCQRNPGFSGKVSIIAHSLGGPIAVDILSNQPTWVPPLKDQTPEQLRSSENFCFNTRGLIFAGSPTAIFFLLNGAQLIPRRGRARTQDAGKGVAADDHRWGCLAVDCIWNVYNILDPVAYLMGPVCDKAWAKEHTRPVAIPAQTYSMLGSFSSSLSKLWGGFSIPRPTRFATTVTNPEAPELVEAVDRQEQAEFEHSLDSSEKDTACTDDKQDSKALSEKEQRAAARFHALNPSGVLDYFLPDDSTFGTYLNMLSSHTNYWTDIRFSAFLVTQLFADDAMLAKARQKQEEEVRKASAAKAGEAKSKGG